MRIGYARVSTGKQNLDLQIDALTEAGCEKIFTDQISGSVRGRPGIDAALRRMREGDTLVVWKLDRLGRSLTDLVDQVSALHDRGIGFESLREKIDTSSAGARFQFHIFSALAQFERDLIRERTRAGMHAARARGKRLGRPRALTDTQVAKAADLVRLTNRTLTEIGAEFGVSRSTLYRYITPEGDVRATASLV